MKFLRFHALVLVCATFSAVGCDGDEGTVTHGTGSYGGSTIGNVTRGGSSSGLGLGGASRGGSSSQFGSGGTGATGVGGAASGTLTDACARTCVTMLGLGCAATPYTSQAECQSDCLAETADYPTCLTEYTAWMVCTADQPASSWYCDDVDGAQYNADACYDLAMAVVDCGLGGA